jgi:hypothetical protein
MLGNRKGENQGLLNVKKSTLARFVDLFASDDALTAQA